MLDLVAIRRFSLDAVLAMPIRLELLGFRIQFDAGILDDGCGL